MKIPLGLPGLLLVVAVQSALAGVPMGSEDCNGNEVPDADEVTPAFLPRSVSSEAFNPDGVVAADLDGDGDVDVASSGVTPLTLAWYENLGTGHFGPEQPISDHWIPERLSAVDLDSDGDLDLLVTYTPTGGRLVAWYENTDGAGTFGSARTISDSPNVIGASAADLDGDGDPDVIVDAFPTEWFENLDGKGTFGSPRFVAYGNWSHAVDLDLDGDLDLLFASWTSVEWYANLDGAGKFGPGRVIATAGLGLGFATAADVDGDGDADAVVSAYPGNFVAWYENPDDAIAPWVEHLLPDPVFLGQPVLPVDLDGDGDVDLLPGGAVGGAAVWLVNQDGQGQFSPSPLDPASPGSFPAAADVDGDGDMNPIIGNGGGIRWFRNLAVDCNANGVPDDCDLAQGTSDDCNENSVPDGCDIAVAPAGDCNQTGIPDACEIAAGSSQDCAGDGVPDECEADCNENAIPDSCDILSATSLDCGSNGVPDECEPDCNANATSDYCDISSGASDDCNMDGRPDDCDISAGLDQDCNANGILDGCDTVLDFLADTVHTVAQVSIGDRSVFSADLDGDGDNDILFSSEPENKVAWSENTDGLGSFGPEQTVDANVDDVKDVFSADLDGDGDVDLLSASDDGVAWYENTDGSGSFGPPMIVEPLRATLVAAADIDGDGDADIVAQSFGQFAWYENLDGAGGFGPGQAITPDPNNAIKALDLVDLDGDGDLDALAGFRSDPFSMIAWYRNLDGEGSFGPQNVVCSTNPSYDVDSVRGADMDLDGDLDIIFAQFSADVIWCENLDGAGAFGLQHLVASGEGTQSAIPVDLDGDGDSDVLQARFYAGRISWRENLDGSGRSFGRERFVSVNHEGIFSIFVTDLDRDGDPDVVSSAERAEEVTWYRNLSDDCNGNALPDVCDPDCNASGIVDQCEIRNGSSIDCNANDVPDECETTCVDCDTDGDLCLDEIDCLPNDESVWSTPGVIRKLVFTSAAGDILNWNAPDRPGSTTVQYDLLRSADDSDFHAATLCLESDTPERSGSDANDPLPGEIFYYLVRVENDCGSTLGIDSDGFPRTGKSCP